jgi:hypothetical protein
MPLYSETYTDVANRFKRWIAKECDNADDNITDVTLDYINQANQSLWNASYWDDFMVHSDLTVSSRAASLPSDFGKLYAIYHDQNGNDKPDWFYYKDGRYGRGYRLVTTNTKAAAATFSITFFRNPSYTPSIIYQKTLANFTGTGTEYIYWPALLLLREAQLLFKEDADDLDASYDKLEKRRNRELELFQMHHTFTNADMEIEIKDAMGNALDNENYDLGEGGDGVYNPYDNTTDDGT